MGSAPPALNDGSPLLKVMVRVGTSQGFLIALTLNADKKKVERVMFERRSYKHWPTVLQVA